MKKSRSCPLFFTFIQFIPQPRRVRIRWIQRILRLPQNMDVHGLYADGNGERRFMTGTIGSSSARIACAFVDFGACFQVGCNRAFIQQGVQIGVLAVR